MKIFGVRNSILIAALALMIPAPASAVASYDESECDRDCRRDLASTRAATAKYHDVQRAFADGFINTGQCVQHPVLGAMGIHFINPARIGNPALDPAEPEVLLYMPEDGEFRLVGLEYVRPGPSTMPVPQLFGQHFHHSAVPMNQWALHVWVWRNNPSGMFADFNPQLSCF